MRAAILALLALVLVGCAGKIEIEPEPIVYEQTPGPHPHVYIELETQCALIVSAGQWYVYQLGDDWTNPPKTCERVEDFGTAVARPWGNSPFGEVHYYPDPWCVLTCEDVAP